MTADEQEVTVGELFRALGKVEKAVDDGFQRVNDRIDKLRSEFVSKELYESEQAAQDEKIANVGVARRYQVTTALTAVMAVAAFVTPFIHK